MKGRIKAGEGPLIGNAGEHYVMAELLKRRIIAALAPRNVPGFDILATRHDMTVRIRVKTKSADYDCWQWNAKPDGSIFRSLSKKNDFTVMVDLTPETRDLKFFLVPTAKLDRWLKRDFKRWVETRGAKGQRRSKDNKRRILHFQRYRTRLKEGNWDILWQ
jgi:hypothetical protein